MRIDRDASSSILLLLLLCFVFMIISHNVPCSNAAANPLLFNCTSKEEYTPNGAFESNLKLLLSSISSNTTALSKGFYDYSVGTDDTNQVYGLALCRGNISLDICYTCLEKATKDILYFCPNKRDAIIWYEYCQLRYSYYMFFSQMVYSADQLPPRNVCQHNVFNPTNFYLIEYMLMVNIIDEAASSSERKFATGETTINGTGNVFGLAECSPYISHNHCSICLFNAMDDVSKCSSHQGGMVLGRSCNLMLQVSPFKGRIDKHIYFVIPAAVLLVLLLAGYYGFYLWRRKKRKERQEDEEVRRNMLQGDEVLDDFSELPFINFDTVKVATGNFSDSNKLGEGGFGTVYKGTLPDGKEIAVKRLSRRSRQGLEEFKNEVILIAKLQHRNLVRLLGCGIEGEEKLLIYEFMSNGSLDFLIFDPIKRSQLHWATRYQIIDGIGRGLLYLHEGSRLKIIHRDIKTSNVLLDEEMTAKISDFGMARIFCEDQNNANTKRVVGTYGYMSPEYAMQGTFSMKSDIFSFGVILLEIISGKRNNSYLMEYGQTLLAHVWRLWNEGKALDFVDPWLISSSSRTEILRCMHIGLLCVQREAADRPTMSNVIVMLRCDSRDLPQPKEPAFTLGRVLVKTDQSTPVICSVNEATISNDMPR